MKSFQVAVRSVVLQKFNGFHNIWHNVFGEHNFSFDPIKNESELERKEE